MSHLFILLLCFAYLLGSVSFAVLLSQLGQLPDPRSLGSGNPGASNMLRLGNRPLALATLLGDMGKGCLAVWLAAETGLGTVEQAWVGLFAVIGHVLPIFHRLQGGKGVATGAGVVLLLSWPAAIWIMLVWLGCFAATRIASLASMLACLALLPWLAWQQPQLLLPCSIMVALILIRHRLNIGRLLNGNESRFRE